MCISRPLGRWLSAALLLLLPLVRFPLAYALQPFTVGESTESFSLNLSGPTNTAVLKLQGVGTINDTDAQSSGVVSRKLFYNNSKYDGNNAAATAQDDAAIAVDKAALLPGGTATFANYTSFSKGINGVMVDISNLPGPLSADDFIFRVGNNNSPGSWSQAPAPTTVNVRNGAGQNGSSRVEILWPDLAISKTWLQVTVKANAQTGLATPDVFYFGNAIGEAGNSMTNAQVTAGDEIEARNDPHNILNPAPITNRHDYDRNGLVNAGDQIVARNNGTTLLSRLALINPPAASAAAPADAYSLLGSEGGSRASVASPLVPSSGTNVPLAVPRYATGSGSLAANSASQEQSHAVADLDSLFGASDDLDADLLELLATGTARSK
jgi:hypothetical protein